MDGFGRRTGNFTLVMDGDGQPDAWTKSVRGGLAQTLVLILIQVTRQAYFNDIAFRFSTGNTIFTA